MIPLNSMTMRVRLKIPSVFFFSFTPFRSVEETESVSYTGPSYIQIYRVTKSFVDIFPSFPNHLFPQATVTAVSPRPPTSCFLPCPWRVPPTPGNRALESEGAGEIESCRDFFISPANGHSSLARRILFRAWISPRMVARIPRSELT